MITDAQFWKYEKETGKLENKACNWIHADLSWDVPEEGEEGFVEDRSDPSLGVMTVMKKLSKRQTLTKEKYLDSTECEKCGYDQSLDGPNEVTTDDKNDTNDDSSDDKNDIPIIEVKAKDDMLLIDQIWLRTFVNDNGYFTLENQESGAVLTATSCPKKYKNSELEGLHWVSITLFTLQR